MINKQNICNRCIMDLSAVDISFDHKGNCNYCNEFIERSRAVIFKKNSERLVELNNFISKVKKAGHRKKYDCVIGISGGVDSSWALVKAVEFGLRPLAVHMDNGWNSDLAQNNISNLINKLNIDLYTYVIDWQEYRSLMQTFFDADVVDIELLYDNAMLGVNYKQASKFRIKNILAGTNQSTEGMRMPPNWNWMKFDKKNIKAISRKFSKNKIRSFPAIGTLNYVYFEYFRKIRWVSFLDLFDYSKDKALDELKKFDYRPYPYKHGESVFTRFYQGYILPKKFNVDKRKQHLSNLIVTNQISRNEALEEIQSDPYNDPKSLQEDIEYFLKKMKWSENDLEKYLARKPINHDFYNSEKKMWDLGKRIINSIKKK